jgi:hypothetical protein
MPELKLCLRRNVVVVFLLFLILFTSCENQANNNTENPAEGTFVEFENLEQYPVTVYSDTSRTNVLVQVNALSKKTVKAEPAPLGTAFYPTFQFSFEIGTTKINIPFDGTTIIAAIEKDKTNIVKIPKLESVEINKAYILLINDSDFSLTFREGNTEKIPIGGGTSIINSGLSAAYEIPPGVSSGYSIRKNTTDPVAFPVGLTEFSQGIIYKLTYTNTGLELTGEDEVINYDGSNIKWSNDSNGTLKIDNNASKDMVLFIGMITPNNIIGGVRAGVSKDFNISSKVSDFQAGGRAVIYGITIDDYNANIENLSAAKVKYSAMVIYGGGRAYKTNIASDSIGDYMYRVTNNSRYGLELRKNNPDGERIDFIPAFAINWSMYANNTDPVYVFPVYVLYNATFQMIMSFTPNENGNPVFVTVTPRGANSGQVQTYTFSINQEIPITSPVAYMNVTNYTNLNCRVNIANNTLTSVNGFNTINSGDTLRYAITSTYEGMEQDIIIQYLNGLIELPVRFTDDTTPPVIKNGYFYRVTVSGSGTTADGYTVTLTDNGPMSLDELGWQ